MARPSAYLAAGLSLVLAACATPPAKAPVVAARPTKAVEVDRFYSGVWHEIARNPLKLTDGCVAGITAFSREGKGRIIDRDSCRMGDPDTGREKVFAGPIDLLDPPVNASFATHYRVFGLFTVSRTYWVLDHDDAQTWFIVATPDLQNLSIFARDPRLPLLERGRLVDRARALGYQGLLEYPAQPRT